MAVISIRPDYRWFTSAWAFEHVLNRTLPIIASEGLSELVARIQQSLVNGSVYLDLKNSSPAELAAFAKGVLTAHAQYSTEGGDRWQDRRFYEPFMKSLKEFMDMVQRDPRLQSKT